MSAYPVNIPSPITPPLLATGTVLFVGLGYVNGWNVRGSLILPKLFPNEMWLE